MRGERPGSRAGEHFAQTVHKIRPTVPSPAAPANCLFPPYGSCIEYLSAGALGSIQDQGTGERRRLHIVGWLETRRGVLLLVDEVQGNPPTPFVPSISSNREA